MRNLRLILSLVALAISTSAFATPKQPAESLTIRKTLDLLVHANNAGQIAALASLYSEDVVIVPSHGDPIVGRRRALDESRLIIQQQQKLSMSADETVVKQDTAFVRGKSHGWRKDAQTGTRREFTENYVAVLRNQCGKWRVARLIWDDDSADSKL